MSQAIRALEHLEAAAEIFSRLHELRDGKITIHPIEWTD
jgi:hypothetical protein